ncbi:MAG: hypothetical protein ACI8UO_003871 [Verrucomicrobiales bacterium]|jgi:hypothetical protein
MPKKLQRFENDAVTYDRPNLKWACGHVCEGRSCALGPSKRGDCRGGSECIPLKRGDRWTCTRSSFYGGPCADGPGADGKCCNDLAICKPDRTLRAKRKIAALLAVAATIGLVLIFLGGSPSTRESLIDPGPLTTAHAGSSTNCAACHGDDIALTTSIHERALAMNQNCLTCHAAIAGKHEESTSFAHGLPAETLRDLTAKSQNDHQQLLISLASNSPIVDAGATGSLACATCHQEHHGQQASLIYLTNQQCQVCHQKQFDSFAHGHPDFNDTAYPFWQRTRIHFDHESHYGGHFSEKTDRAPEGFDQEKPFSESASCRTCHVTDASGSHMRLVGYDKSCGACHADAVNGGNPIPFLTLPHAPHHDHADKTEHGMGVPPILLAALSDQSRSDLLSTDSNLADEPDINGMVQLSEADLEGPIMAELREFHHTLWENGPSEFEERLLANGWIVPEGSGQLFAGLSLDSMRQFLFPGTKWELGDLAFPELDIDSINKHLAASNRSIGLWPERANAKLSPLLRHLLAPQKSAADALSILNQNSELELADLSKATQTELAAAAILAWEIKELHHLIQERGAPFLEQFVELQGGILEVGNQEQVMESVFFMAKSDELFMAGFHAEIIAYRAGNHPPKVAPASDQPAQQPKPASGGDDDDFGSDPAPAAADDDFGSDPAPAPTATDDDFESDPVPAPAAADDDDFGSDPVPAPAPADDDFGSDEPEKHEDHDHGDSPEYQVFEPSAARDWQRGGGWFYEHFSLNYLSRGHADPALKTWLDAITKTASEGKTPRAREDALAVLRYNFDFRSGHKSSAAGSCLKCHTIDSKISTEGNLSLQINWKSAFGKPIDTFELTRFSHSSHMHAMECAACHSFARDEKYPTFFPTEDPWSKWPGAPDSKTNPHEFSSNFSPIDHQQSCATCHTPQAAGNSCLDCHFYHHRPIGTKRMTRMSFGN